MMKYIKTWTISLVLVALFSLGFISTAHAGLGDYSIDELIELAKAVNSENSEVILAALEPNREGIFGIAEGSHFGLVTMAQLEVTGNVLMSGTVEISSTLTVANTIKQSNLSEYVSSASFADVTTTLFCVQNPFSTTSTADLAQLAVTTAATSTIDLSVVTSTNAHPTGIFGTSLLGATTTPSFINGTTFATNTLGTVINGTTLGSKTGILSPSTGYTSATRLQIAPTDYLCGVATASKPGGILGGITDIGNQFEGGYSIRWIKGKQ